MMLGLEQKRKKEQEDEQEHESCFFLGSQQSQLQDRGDSSSESCKDVDVVSVIPELSTCTTAALRPGIGYQDDFASLEYDSGNDALGVASPSIFDFQKSERSVQRVPLSPFSKPAPSKWDDAQKWIASPNSNRPKVGQSPGHIGQAMGAKKPGNLGYGGVWQPSSKVLMEVLDHRSIACGEPDTKRIDFTHSKKDFGDQKFVSWENDPSLIAESYDKPVMMIENSLNEAAVSLSQHDSSIYNHSATTFVPPPSTARSVSMRDMGTEMTPIASQEPSRTGTPVRATTPIRSPRTSRPSSPGRTTSDSSLVGPTKNEHLSQQMKDLSETEIQKNTRREIMLLGEQLGKSNIAAWASKVSDNGASTSMKSVTAEQQAKSLTDTRATAWEEAEKAKYLARFKREEIKIVAWENHQKAKTEAEMRKTEVEVERMRGQAHDKLMNKLAAVRHKAEEKRAAAEAKRSREAAKTEQQAEYIRRTGRIPHSFSCCNWCY